ncbi:MAG: phospholipase [Nocardioides sp.]|nr:phospholipase [Nocardioides sp.]
MSTPTSSAAVEPPARTGRLSFRPRGGGSGARPGTTDLGTPATPALLHLPSGVGDGPTRVVVLLHGSGGAPARTLELLRDQADRDRFVLLVPKSRARTWDVVAGGYGPDVRALDRLLAEVDGLVDAGSWAVAGFSDGASYALSLGVGNGDLFDSVVAFSPGFAAPEVAHGRPRFFVSHGVDDRVLPIERCSRRLVPALRGDGYEVAYREFDGEHEVPDAVRDEAARWLREG